MTAKSEEDLEIQSPKPTLEDARMKTILNYSSAVLNVASSISIVFANKWVFQKHGFKYGTFLTMCHFFVTFIGLCLCTAFKVFEVKKIPWNQVWPLSLSFCGFVVLTNLSLQFNSVGFYQMAKVLTTPCIVLMQYTLSGHVYSHKVLINVLIICLGVALASVTDVQFNLIGTFYALTGVVVTSYYQIGVGTKQKECGVNSMQLLFYQAPVSALMLMVMLPWIEDVRGVIDYAWDSQVMVSIGWSCFLAFFVNLSTFMVIGRLSPLTYNVIGHTKLCLILLMGFIFFDGHPSAVQLCGVFIAFIGIVGYKGLYIPFRASAFKGFSTPNINPSPRPLLPKPLILGGDLSKKARKMSESYCEIKLPFQSDPIVQEDYINVYGGLRIGRLLEDMDALAGAIAYRHCMAESFDRITFPPPMMIVTASVDRIDLFHQLDKIVDVKMSGHVSYVGSSSMEILIYIDKKTENGYECVAIARFINVARDKKWKPFKVNPLLIETKLEHDLFRIGESKKSKVQVSMAKAPPTPNESETIHNLLYGALINPEQKGSLWMEETRINSSHFCHLQYRNMHNFMFGGTLMRLAYELAFSNACLFVHGRPLFKSLDDISFVKPVPIGSILSFSSQVIFVEKNDFQIRVVADVVDIPCGNKETTNIFNLNFSSGDSPLPWLKPKTYVDTILYLEGKRRSAQGIDLKKEYKERLF